MVGLLDFNVKNMPYPCIEALGDSIKPDDAVLLYCKIARFIGVDAANVDKLGAGISIAALSNQSQNLKFSDEHEVYEIINSYFDRNDLLRDIRDCSEIVPHSKDSLYPEHCKICPFSFDYRNDCVDVEERVLNYLFMCGSSCSSLIDYYRRKGKFPKFTSLYRLKTNALVPCTKLLLDKSVLWTSSFSFDDFWKESLVEDFIDYRVCVNGVERSLTIDEVDECFHYIKNCILRDLCVSDLEHFKSDVDFLFERKPYSPIKTVTLKKKRKGKKINPVTASSVIGEMPPGNGVVSDNNVHDFTVDVPDATLDSDMDIIKSLSELYLGNAAASLVGVVDNVSVKVNQDNREAGYSESLSEDADLENAVTISPTISPSPDEGVTQCCDAAVSVDESDSSAVIKEDKNEFKTDCLNDSCIDISVSSADFNDCFINLSNDETYERYYPRLSIELDIGQSYIMDFGKCDNEDGLFYYCPAREDINGKYNEILFFIPLPKIHDYVRTVLKNASKPKYSLSPTSLFTSSLGIYSCGVEPVSIRYFLCENKVPSLSALLEGIEINDNLLLAFYRNISSLLSRYSLSDERLDLFYRYRDYCAAIGFSKNIGNYLKNVSVRFDWTTPLYSLKEVDVSGFSDVSGVIVSVKNMELDMKANCSVSDIVRDVIIKLVSSRYLYNFNIKIINEGPTGFAVYIPAGKSYSTVVDIINLMLFKSYGSLAKCKPFFKLEIGGKNNNE